MKRGARPDWRRSAPPAATGAAATCGYAFGVVAAAPVAAWRAQRANPDMHPPSRSRAAIERAGCIGSAPRVSEYSRPSARNRRLDTDVYREPDRPVFVTVRAAGALAPFRDARLNDAVVVALLAQRLHCGCALYAHCLMPDHIHFVAAPGEDGDVSALIERFKSTSTRIAWGHGRAGRLWQPRWYDHVVRHDESLGRSASTSSSTRSARAWSLAATTIPGAGGRTRSPDRRRSAPPAATGAAATDGGKQASVDL